MKPGPLRRLALCAPLLSATARFAVRRSFAGWPADARWLVTEGTTPR